MHECEYPPCQETVESAMLFCRSHWYEVPKGLRDAVWSTWMARRRAPSSEGARGEHQRAKREAIRALDTRRGVTRDYEALELA